MARIAVFDSGLGSLSVIGAIRRRIRCEIVYLADRRSFPYGGKSRPELARIVRDTVRMLDERFGPDLVVVGSNTPTLMLDLESVGGGRRVIGVLPPVREAAGLSATGNIAVLATGAVVGGGYLAGYVRSQELPGGTAVHGIDCSRLVGVVESGGFATDPAGARRAVTEVLEERFERNRIDVATLSSTHLPFLRKILEGRFPGTRFLDPAGGVARRVSEMVGSSAAEGGSLRIYCTGDVAPLEANLRRMGMRDKVTSL